MEAAPSTASGPEVDVDGVAIDAGPGDAASRARSSVLHALSVFGAKPEVVDAHITKFLKDSIIGKVIPCMWAGPVFETG